MKSLEKYLTVILTIVGGYLVVAGSMFAFFFVTAVLPQAISLEEALYTSLIGPIALLLLPFSLALSVSSELWVELQNPVIYQILGQGVIFGGVGYYIGFAYADRKSPRHTQGGWLGIDDFQPNFGRATPIRRLVWMPLGSHSPAELEEHLHPETVEFVKLVSMYSDGTIGFRKNKSDESEHQIPLIEAYLLAKNTSMVSVKEQWH